MAKSVTVAAVTGVVAGFALCKLLPRIRQILAKKMPKTKPTIFYYPARGRAEQLRLVFAEAEVDFDDETFDMSKDEEKKKFLMSCAEKGGNSTTNIPMVEIDGLFLTQSGAALRYLARKFGLYPGEGETQACYHVDNMLDAAEDLRTANYKPMKMFGGTDESKEHYIKNVLPQHLGNFARLLGSRDYFGRGFMDSTANKPTVADVSIYDTLHVCERQVPGSVLGKDFPSLAAYFQRMEARPGIKRWVHSEQRGKLWPFPEL